MSEFLLDTNVVSELQKGSRSDAGVIDLVDQHPGDSFWLSVIVVGGLSRGIGIPDALIAATGLEHDLIMVSRNVDDIERSGAESLNPFVG